MYDLVDRPVTDLAAGDRDTLMAMRRWVHATILVGDAPGAAEGAFGAAMRLIDRSSTEELAIARPCGPIVGESEAVLLSLWRLAADGDARATALAAMIVAPDDAASLVSAIVAAGR